MISHGVEISIAGGGGEMVRGTSEYNVFYSDIQDPRQEPTNPDPDLSLRDQPRTEIVISKPSR